MQRAESDSLRCSGDAAPDHAIAGAASARLCGSAGAVTFRLFAAAREAAGTSDVTVPCGTVREVLHQLCGMLPPRFSAVLAASSLLCDGFRLDPQSAQWLPAGTVVEVLPPFAGG